MLKNLKVQNYALIQNLDIEFNGDFSTLTGETGAGKSIMLGALSLVLGARADLSALQNNENKCVIEAVFDIEAYKLKGLFKQLDLDYEAETVIRREINTSGKSRAFVNDTPVNLSDLKELSSRLIDIHSQHENLHLNDSQFQLRVIDAVAKNQSAIDKYKIKYGAFKQLQKTLNNLNEQAKSIASDYEYNLFQFKQLDELKLDAIDMNALEEEMQMLSNAEDIQQNLAVCFSVLSEGEFNTLEQLKTARQALLKIQDVFSKAENLANRIESAVIELKDIAQETEYSAETVTLNPERAQEIKTLLDGVYDAMHKHRVETVEELLAIKEQFEIKVDKHDNIDHEIAEVKGQLNKTTEELQSLAKELSDKRKKAIEPFKKKVVSYLTDLGMPYASFKVDLESNAQFHEEGVDKVVFLFSANKNQEEQSIAKIASGGEISRLMLSIKSILSESVAMPTIIFDEIDTGVSGEIAAKMAQIMTKMAKNMQVVSITHLPQIAAKGKSHYKVFKKEDDQSVQTKIVRLGNEERIAEIARMLSGSNVSKEAVENAKTLIQA